MLARAFARRPTLPNDLRFAPVSGPNAWGLLVLSTRYVPYDIYYKVRLLSTVELY